MAFFAELKRRNVIRVGLLYLVASSLVIQLVDASVSLLELPSWIGRLLFLLLAIGFPIALALSWIYELTPEGVRREEHLSDDYARSETTRKLDVTVTALLVLAIGALALDRFIPSQPVSGSVPVAGANPGNSIAVLPFVNMSPDADNVYFSDGLTEELLNLLAKIPELKVAARTSAFAFKDSDAGIDEIASKLNVAYVLEGSVRKAGSKVRITAQLIESSSGYHRWSETWDRELVDIFAIQDEIAAAVVQVVGPELLGVAPQAYETEVEAFELGLRARAAANRFTAEGLKEALALNKQALAIDPNYADAWYGLSIVYSNMVSLDVLKPSEGFEKAREAALRALEIDPKHPKSLSSLGWIAMYWERDMDKATDYMRRALALAPGDPRILNAYATLQSAFGRFDEAIELYRAALRADPLSVPVLSNLALQLMEASAFGEARELLDRIEDSKPDSFMVDRNVAWLKLSEGKFDEAIPIFERLTGLFGQWGLALCYAGLGDTARSDELIGAMRADSSSLVAIAGVYAFRGDNDRAFESLEEALRTDVDAIMEVRMFSSFATIHGDARWEPLLEELGLSDADARRLGL